MTYRCAHCKITKLGEPFSRIDGKPLCSKSCTNIYNSVQLIKSSGTQSDRVTGGAN